MQAGSTPLALSFLQQKGEEGGEGGWKEVGGGGEYKREISEIRNAASFPLCNASEKN